MPPGGPFRASYSYSNYGITLGAVAATRSTGVEWADVAQKYLYDPLGMSSTSSRYSDFETRSNRADLHILQNGTWAIAPSRNPDPQAPAGGVTSSVTDLAQWLRLHLSLGMFNGQNITDEAALNETRLPHIIRGLDPVTGNTGFYGLGWDVDYEDGRVYVSHAGAFSQGTRSYALISIDEGIGIVILANCFPTGVPEGIAYTLLDWIHYGNSTEDWVQTWDGSYSQLAEQLETSPDFGQPPANPSAALRDAAYIGMYSNDYVGVVEVMPGSMGLELHLESNTTFPLQHWDRDVFILQTEDAEQSAVTFQIDPQGNATLIVIEGLNSNGGGVLMKVL
jgi:CubicO group peptidase (beta-lactamase class C family)